MMRIKLGKKLKL